MEEIIARLSAEMVKNICEKAFCCEWQGLAELTGQVKEICMTTGRKVVEECIRSINQALREDKAKRKELGLVLHEKDRSRKMLTEMGQIDISRDYYREKKSGKYVYPLDELLDVKRYERIDSNVRASLVWEACEQSYQRSAEHVTEEDHVHMQKAHKEKGKKNKIVPLVTVTEGSRAVSASRNETINPVHFVDKDFDAKQLWTSVNGYLLEAYEIEDLERVYIHGDGGRWIQNGLSEIRNVVMVMDKYHSEKAIRKIDALFPKRRAGYRLRKTLRRNDYEGALKIIESLKSKAEDEKTKESLSEFFIYLKNNWNALVSRYKGELPGSCTEGQVSHVLSERFSRNPMGWSEEALGKLSKARIYKLNGGERLEVIKHHTNESTYAAYYKEYLDEYLNEKLDWRIFEKSLPVFDTNSGTQRLIKMIGQAV